MQTRTALGVGLGVPRQGHDDRRSGSPGLLPNDSGVKVDSYRRRAALPARRQRSATPTQ